MQVSRNPPTPILHQLVTILSMESMIQVADYVILAILKDSYGVTLVYGTLLFVALPT